jgi:hypothetical protein
MGLVSDTVLMEQTLSDYAGSAGSIRAGSVLDDGLDNVLMMDPATARRSGRRSTDAWSPRDLKQFHTIPE